MLFCAGDGTLAPSSHPVPTDPTVLHRAGSRAVTPCSAIACSACGCRVRWVDEAWYDGDAGQIEGVYTLADPLTSPVVRGPSGDRRLYFCRCHWFNCTTSMGLFLRFELDQSDLPSHWSCAGHPPSRPSKDGPEAGEI